MKDLKGAVSVRAHLFPGENMDIQLNYVQRGCGETLILLHGNGESNDYFEHQIEYFSEKYSVIALDTRGHGKSPRGNAPFTIEQFSTDLRDFMDEKGIESAHVLGFSDGGNIALTFALKNPHRLRSLVLNGANLYPKGVKLSAQLPVELGYRVLSFVSKKDPGAVAKKEMLGLMINEPNIAPKELEKLAVPTLVIAGTRDMIKESHTRLIFESLPVAQLKLIEGDHFIAGKNPRQFNEAVEEFLNKNKSP